MNAEFAEKIGKACVHAFAPMLLIALAIAGARLWRAMNRKTRD